jgi:hypothetical protein
MAANLWKVSKEDRILVFVVGGIVGSPIGGLRVPTYYTAQ